MSDFNGLLGAISMVLVEGVKFGLERIEPGHTGGRGSRGLLTRKQTADRLAMSLTTLHERRKAGLLLPVDDDGRMVYRVADVDTYERKLRQME